MCRNFPKKCVGGNTEIANWYWWALFCLKFLYRNLRHILRAFLWAGFRFEQEYGRAWAYLYHNFKFERPFLPENFFRKLKKISLKILYESPIFICQYDCWFKSRFYPWVWVIPYDPSLSSILIKISAYLILVFCLSNYLR